MENKKLRGISMDINKSWFARILSPKFKIVANLQKMRSLGIVQNQIDNDGDLQGKSATGMMMIVTDKVKLQKK